MDGMGWADANRVTQLNDSYHEDAHFGRDRSLAGLRHNRTIM